MSKTNSNGEKILTLNVNGKKGVNIDRSKYDQVRNTILQIMKPGETITMSELSEQVKNKLDGKFDGKIGWYYMAVKLDMEARSEIERVANKSPQTLKLAKNLA